MNKLILGVTGLLVVLASCGSDNSDQVAGVSQSSGPLVIATTTIWADVVEQVSCGQANVESIVPAGSDPHSFEPSLQDRGRLEEATLIIRTGAGLEEALGDTLDVVADNGSPTFAVSDHIGADLLGDDFGDGHQGHDDDGHEEEEGHEDEEGHDDDGHEDEGGHEGEEGDSHDGHKDDHDDHAHADGDPHFWLNPLAVIEALPHIAEALVEHSGLDKEATDECLERYRGELEAVDGQIIELVQGLPVEKRKLVTSHDAFSYFAERYKFDVVGTVIPTASTLAQPSAGHLDELADTIGEEQISTIFAESQHSTDDVDALAERVPGVEVVVLSVGTLGPPGTDADSYAGLLLNNAELIVEGLR